jgi:surfactin family lipopeptide synthetase A
MFERSAVKNAYPLSPMQEGILFHYLVDGKSRAYHQQVSYRIKGELNIDLFEQAFNILIKRHDILRTVFVYEKVKRPLQAVFKERTAGVYYEDISHLTGSEKLTYIREFKEKDKASGFDLSKDIPVRYSVLKTSQECYEVIRSQHHIIVDGWCAGILIKEMLSIYSNLKDGKPVNLPKIVPYSVYINWLEKQDKEEAVNYWKIYLENYDTRVSIPKRKYGNGNGYRRKEHWFSIMQPLTETLEQISRENRVTLNTSFQALWGILLRQYNNTDDVVFGSVVSCRSSGIPGIESMMGLFINTIPVRIQSRDGETFEALLKRVQDEMVTSRKYDYIPLAEIQANTPLKQELLTHIVAFENFPVDKEVETLGKTKNLGFSLERADSVEQTNYELDVVVVPGKELNILLRYDSELYDEVLIRRTGEHLLNITRQITSNPAVPLEEIELLSQTEKKRLLDEFNHVNVGYPKDKTIHELFEEQEKKTPDRVAVVGSWQGAAPPTDKGAVGKKEITGEAVQLTYRELNEKAGRLTHVLREKGVQPDTIVGIMMERSVEMIIGMLGILKAGGAYLPIDPDYPGERIEYMLSDSKTRFLVSELSEVSGVSGGIAMVKPGELSEELPTHLTHLTHPTHLCYVIYTSGTTGRPKGTLIEHKNVVRLMFNDTFLFDFNSSDVWTMFHSHCFDFSVWEMYGALLYGGRLVVIPKMTARDPRAFRQILRNEGVTVLNQVPTSFDALLAEEMRHEKPEINLRYIIFGGEALMPAKLKEWKERYPHTRLINMYGITETTVHVTYKEIDHKDIQLNISNIGKPIPTLTAYMMDRNLKLQPSGVPGELCVGGEGVGRGYLNRIELTIEKFIENPYIKGERLYRSGDLARISENGDMEYSGRIDHQVKIRGYRVELGEIESQLIRHPHIKEAVVLIHEGTPGSEAYLAAYVVPGNKFGAAGVREYLSAKLPDFMVPSFFVSLDKMPLTPNGKVDRKALMKFSGKVEENEGRLLPTNPTEAKLVETWKSFLSLETVGIKDNFFNIGGDSIKAIRLINVINDKLDSNLEIVDLYVHGTIQELAEKINRDKDRAVDGKIKQEVCEEIEALKNRILTENKDKFGNEVEDIYPMSDIETGMMFHSLKEVSAAVYHDQMVYQVKFDGFDAEKFGKAFILLAAKHSVLRMGFNVEDFKEPVQIVYKEVKHDIRHEDISTLEKSEQIEYVKRYLLTDRQDPLDASSPSLWRLRTFDLGNGEICVLFVAHHAILDGWSVASLMTELYNTYLALESNPGFIPGSLKSSCKDFVIQQLVEKKKTEVIDFWKEELADYKRLDFSGFKDNGERKGAGLECIYSPGEELFKKLEVAAVKYRTTVKNLCFAAYIYMLYMISYDNDFTAGVVTHNRPLCEDGEKILGCFLNTVPFRMRIPGNVTWIDFIGIIDKKMLQLKTYERLSLYEIIRIIGEKTTEQNPLFDTLFSFIDFHVFEQGHHYEEQMDNPNTLPVKGQVRTNTLFDFIVNTTFGGFSVVINYTDDILNPEDVEKLFHCFKRVLEVFVHDPHGAAEKSKIISPREKEKLLEQFNHTASSYPAHQTIHRLFEELVDKTPDRVAVVGSRQLAAAGEKRSGEMVQLTYGELNEISDRLVHLLRAKGVGGDTIVGIMVEHSLEMIVGILGILKAGGAYVPLDHDYPEKRVEFILKDSNAKVLLTAPAARVKVKEEFIELIDISKQLPSSTSTLTSPPGNVNSSNLAYVIYTSGTTGEPRGVMVEHRGLVNYICWAVKLYIKGEKVNFPLYSSLSFDLTVTSIYSPLVSGNTIYIYQDENRELLIHKIVEDNRVHIIKLTPSHLKLMSYKDLQHSNLRRLIVGGEQLDTPLAREIYKKFNGKVEIYNEYGPTETVVGCMIYQFDPVDDYEAVPIGVPADNVQIYLLDCFQKLLPQGIAGEICVSGDGVARGYLNRPGLTAERFPDNPYIMGKRLYRTSDFGKFLSVETMGFLGRKDHQVKIRGFRIELGEVEGQLLKYDPIKEALVIDRANEDGSRYLCAYIAAKPGVAVDAAEVRDYLAARLPVYMIPLYFVKLDRLPLTPNGKINRSALPAPDESAVGSGNRYVAPRSSLEWKMVETWEQVLGREGIGIHDNFFEMGGDSIKTIQIAARMKKVGYTILMKDIFQHPTIAQLAPIARKVERIPDQSPVTGIVPLIPIQCNFFKSQYADMHHYNQVVLFHSQERLEEACIEAIFTRLQEHHDVLRMTYRQEKGHILQINRGLDCPLSLGVYDYRDKQKEEALHLMEIRARKLQSTIDLENGPMMKVGLFHLHDGDRLFIVIHHLVIDAVTMRILFEDIETMFRQYKEGKSLELPLKTDSFKAWAEALLLYADSESFLKEKPYWARLESQHARVPVIKKDFDVEANYRKDTVRLSFYLDEAETHLLLTHVNGVFGTEINDILLTALGLTFKSFFSHQRLLVMLEGHGREEIIKGIDVNRTMGWFTSLYPVILDIAYEGEPARQIKEIKETLRRVPNKGMGYGILKYLTADEHKKGIQFKLDPQVCYNYVGQFDTDVKQTSFTIANESIGEMVSLKAHRQFVLDIAGMIGRNQLIMSIDYNTRQFKQETIQGLLDTYKAELRRIISYCRKCEDKELTPSDLTYKGLSIETLDRLQEQYPLEDIYPLTPMQEGMLFHALYDPSSYAYFIQVSHRLKGKLNIGYLERSLEELFKRYSILRGAFIHEGLEHPLQVILKERQPDLRVEDIWEKKMQAGGEGEDRATFIKEFKENDKKRSFNLDKGALMRVSVIRTGECEYEITWSFHHVLMDGWCTGILISDFLEIYTSFIENRPFQLPGVIPYRRYIKWLERQDKEESGLYWQNYLEGYSQPVCLPRRMPPEPGNGKYDNRKMAFQLGKERTMALNRLARQHHVTLNTIIQVIWGIVLGKYNGNQDVVFGAVVSGRPHDVEDVETIVGLFINTIPVRICCKEEIPFTDLLRQVQQEALNSEPHHYYPLVEIQSRHPLNRDLFDHIVAFENYPLSEQMNRNVLQQQPGGASRKGEFEFSPVEAFEQSNYDLDLVIAPGEQVVIEMRYNGNRLESNTVREIQADVQSVIGQAADNWEIKIRDIKIKGKYYPLSPAQQDLYRQMQEGPERVADSVFTCKWLEQELDREKVEQVFHRLIARHDSLRTSFCRMGNKIVQVVHDIEAMEYDVEFYRSPGDEYHISSIRDAFIRPFDLNRAPLLRIGIIETGERKHILMVNSQRMTADTYSHDILIREFMDIYRGNEIPPLNIQYSHYLEILENEIEKEKMRRQQEYWLKELSGDIPALKLPVDYPGLVTRHPGKGERRGITFEIGAQQEAALKRIGMNERITVDIVFLALYSVTLSKITRQEDIIVGVVSTGRRNNRWEQVTGLFENTLAIRNYPVKEKTFAQFLQEVKEKAADAYNNQDYPVGNLTKNFPVDVMFAYHKDGRLAYKSDPYNESMLAVDLHFHILESREKIILEFEYNPTRFKKGTVERFVGYFKEVLSHVVGNRDIKLKDIPISHNLYDGKSQFKAEDYSMFNF